MNRRRKRDESRKTDPRVQECFARGGGGVADFVGANQFEPCREDFAGVSRLTAALQPRAIMRQRHDGF